MMLSMAPSLFAFLLLVVGLYAIVAKRNLIKVIVGLMILDYAANLLLVLIGYTTVVHAVFMAVPRYRTPIMPAVLVFAALGLVDLVRLSRGRMAGREA